MAELQAAKWLKEADAILIGAAAGMSCESGVDYTDRADFQKKYPGLVKKYGVSCRYDLMGFQEWTPSESCAYLMRHINEMLTVQDTGEYQALKELIQGKPYFVITTNVDEMFHRSGFDPEKIYTPQGSFKRLQCLKPCTKESYFDSAPYVKDLLPKIDSEKESLREDTEVPHCPNCGGKIFANVRGGDWFIHQPYEKQAEKYREWVNQFQNKKIVMIEVGVSPYNTPVWIRYPFSKFAMSFPSANLIRVNLHYPEIEPKIQQKGLGFKGTAKAVLQNIAKELKTLGEEKSSHPNKN